jgi:branched-subunit amino acid transport protein
MMRLWTLVILMGSATLLLKALGPVVLRKREFAPSLSLLLARIAPAMLGALLATQTLARGSGLAMDARLVGLIAAVGCAYLRVPPAITVAASILATAACRHLT